MAEQRKGFDKGRSILETSAVQKGDAKRIQKLAERRARNARDKTRNKLQRKEDSRIAAGLMKAAAKARGTMRDAVDAGIKEADRAK